MGKEKRSNGLGLLLLFCVLGFGSVVFQACPAPFPSHEEGGLREASTGEQSPLDGSVIEEAPDTSGIEQTPDGVSIETQPQPPDEQPEKPVTPTQTRQIKAVHKFVDDMDARHGWVNDFSIDLDALKQQAAQIILRGGGEKVSFYRALRSALLGFPIGHLSISSATLCGSNELPYQNASYYGACARPYKEHFVITQTNASNPLKLKRGDLITAVDGKTKEEMRQWVLSQAMCGTSLGSLSHRKHAAAGSVLGVMPEGTKLTIRSLDGSTREVSLPARSASSLLGCSDPYQGATSPLIQARRRPDGFAVIHIAAFFVLSNPNMPYNEQYQKLYKDLLDTFRAHQDAKGIIWDLRGNRGGMTQLGLHIVGGMPGAKATVIARCKQRVFLSSTVRFNPQSEFYYRLQPGGDFAYKGKVAVLIDGMAGSAADYFARAVKIGTSALLVGAPPVGAYGGVGASFPIGETKDLVAFPDPWRCDDGQDVPLETKATQPHLLIEPTPTDLAKGVDTVLEAAIKELTSP